MLDIYQVVASIVVVVVGFLFLSYRHKKSKQTDDFQFNSGIPGLKPRNEKDGNFEDLAEAGSMQEMLVDLHKAFGPVAAFWWGPKMSVSIYRPEDFRKFSKVFNRPHEMFVFNEPLLGPDNIEFMNNEEGRRRHSAYSRCYSDQRIKFYFDDWHRISKQYTDELASQPPEEHISIREYCFHVAIDSMLQISFGEYYRDVAKIQELRESYDFAWDDMEKRLTGDMPEPGSEREKTFKKHVDRMYASMAAAVDYRKRHPVSEEERVLIVDVLLDVLANDEASLLNDAVTIFVAGFHTTGLLLTWALYYMAYHQDVQDKVYEEINNVLGDRMATLEDKPRLVYLRQVLDETMRHSVLAPFAARVSDHDVEVGGFIIPAETPVVLALGVAMMDEERWEEPERFDPDRFSPDKPKLKVGDFEPFGFAGKRKCPGYRFSYMEALVFLSHVIKRLRVHNVPGQVAEREYGFVTKPKREILLTMSCR